MTMILTDRECSRWDAVKGVGTQVGSTTFALLATLLLASILSLMAVPSIQRDSATNQIEFASVANDQHGDSKADPDEVLRTGTAEPSMAVRSFGPATNFRSSGIASLASDPIITNCYVTSDRCMALTVRAPGLR